jgi:hypothetical protein
MSEDVLCFDTNDEGPFLLPGDLSVSTLVGLDNCEYELFQDLPMEFRDREPHARSLGSGADRCVPGLPYRTSLTAIPITERIPASALRYHRGSFRVYDPNSMRTTAPVL